MAVWRLSQFVLRQWHASFDASCKLDFIVWPSDNLVELRSCWPVFILAHKREDICTPAGNLFLGAQLAGKQSLDLNPLLLAGWAGLVVNALNTIPLGELDGGRIAFAMWGRRAASRIGVVSTLLLGLSGIVDELALYWVLLVLFLQRGPLVPQQEELSEPSKELTPLAVGLLFLPLLVLLPFPFGFSSSPPESLF